MQAQRRIENYIKNNPGTKAGDIADSLKLSRMSVHRSLKVLVNEGKIQKHGNPPHTRYTILEEHNNLSVPVLPAHIRFALEEHRYQVTKTGQQLHGTKGFIQRSQARNLDSVEQAHTWYTYVMQAEARRDKTTVIVADPKLSTYGHDVLAHLRYGEIYALPQFGKTRRGTILEISKVYPSQDVFATILSHVKPQILSLLTYENVDALCFIKPTAKRSSQIMEYLEKHLNVRLPHLPLYKVPGFFPPQKSLKKMHDRIENAKVSFSFEPYKQTHEHVLLIDDAVGSGATLVETGRKILDRGMAKKVSGYGITGTANGLFDEMKQFEVFSSV